MDRKLRYVDSRGRIALTGLTDGRTRYLASVDEHGVITLVPAVVLTKREAVQLYNGPGERIVPEWDSGS
jgi:hypothetical protein